MTHVGMFRIFVDSTFAFFNLLSLHICLQVDLRHIDELNGTNIVEVGVDLSEFYTSVEWDILEVPAVRYVCRSTLLITESHVEDVLRAENLGRRVEEGPETVPLGTIKRLCFFSCFIMLIRALFNQAGGVFRRNLEVTSEYSGES